MNRCAALLVTVFVLPACAFAGHRDCQDYCEVFSCDSSMIEAWHDEIDGCSNWGPGVPATQVHCETTYDAQRKYTWSTLDCTANGCSIRGVLQCPRKVMSGTSWHNHDINLVCGLKNGALPEAEVNRSNANCSWPNGSGMYMECAEETGPSAGQLLITNTY